MYAALSWVIPEQNRCVDNYKQIQLTIEYSQTTQNYIVDLQIEKISIILQTLLKKVIKHSNLEMVLKLS